MSSYPTSLQDLDPTRGTSGQPLSNPNHITHHQLEDDTIEALQAKLGINNSADTTSIDYLLKNSASIDPGHKHTAASLAIALSNLSDVLISSPADGNGLIYNAAAGKWENATTATADASTTVKGVTKLSVAPISSTAPIAVGDNDPRLTTPDSGTAINGSTNKAIDQAAVSATSSANKIPRFNGSGQLDIATMLAIASMAQGDLFYASSSSALARLAAGTAGQFLKTNGSSANPAWANLATATFGTVTRTQSAGTGTVSVTGIGFQPSVVIFIGNEPGNSQSISIGVTNGTTTVGILEIFQILSTSLIFSTQNSSGDTQFWTGTIDTFASDGFNINYLKTGTPGFDFAGYYIALR